MDDFQIMSLFNSKNEAAVSEVQKKYGNFMFSIANRILENRQDAEECVNDSFLKLWKSISPDNPEHFTAYLAVLVRRTAIDLYRHMHSDRRIPPVISDCIDDFADTPNPG